MKKISLLLVLLLTVCLHAFANFDLKVTGFVKTTAGAGVANASLTVSILQGTTGAQMQTVASNSAGKYTAQFSVPDTFSQGTAVIKLLCADSTGSSFSRTWNPTQHVIEQNFTACITHNCDFTLAIQAETTASGKALKAVVTPQPNSTGNTNYTWSNGQSLQTIIVQQPGTYCVTVVLPNGCSKSTCFTYSLPPDSLCQANIEVINIDATHKKLVAIGAGPAPYTYLWTNGATTKDIIVETSGNYCVKITNAVGCVSSFCKQIQFAPPPVDSLCKAKIVIQPLSNTLAKLIASSTGTAPFTYKWSTGATTKTITVNQTGTYCVTVTTANGCASVACSELQFGDGADSCKVKISMQSISPTTSKLTAVPQGTGPFTYLWTTGATTKDIFVYHSGTYCVTVTNAAGCSSHECRYVYIQGNSTGCQIEISKTKIDSFHTKLTAVGSSIGSSPTVYLWSTGAATQSIIVGQSGSYCVTVTIGSPNTPLGTCTVIKCVEVSFFAGTNEEDGFQIDANERRATSPDVTEWAVSPNPAASQLSIKSRQLMENCEIEIFNMLGEIVLAQPLNPSQTSLDISPLAVGIYFYAIKSKGATQQSGKLLKDTL